MATKKYAIRVQVPAALGLTDTQLKSLSSALKAQVASVRSREKSEDLSTIPETNIIIGTPQSRGSKKQAARGATKGGSKKSGGKG